MQTDSGQSFLFEFQKIKKKSCHLIKEVLYLRWNKHHLRAYFETLMALLQNSQLLLRAVFLCETDLVIKICLFVTATTNAENLGDKIKVDFL